MSDETSFSKRNDALSEQTEQSDSPESDDLNRVNLASGSPSVQVNNDDDSQAQKNRGGRLFHTFPSKTPIRRRTGVRVVPPSEENKAPTLKSAQTTLALLDSGDDASIHEIVGEIASCLPDLLAFPSGLEIFEKCLSVCSVEEFVELIQALEPNFFQIASQKLGSKAIQAMMYIIFKEELGIDLLVSIFTKHVASLINCKVGHTLLLTLLTKAPPEISKFIDRQLCSDSLAYATDYNGLRVFRAVIDFRQQKDLTPLLDEVIAKSVILTEHLYGNYLIQTALQRSTHDFRAKFFTKMQGNFYWWARQKCSSNVVETFLKLAPAECRASIISELIVPSGIGILLRDRFGNFVLQTALTVASAQQAEVFVQSLLPHISTLREHLRVKWLQLIEVSTAGSKAAPELRKLLGIGLGLPQRIVHDPSASSFTAQSRQLGAERMNRGGFASGDSEPIDSMEPGMYHRNPDSSANRPKFAARDVESRSSAAVDQLRDLASSSRQNIQPSFFAGVPEENGFGQPIGHRSPGVFSFFKPGVDPLQPPYDFTRGNGDSFWLQQSEPNEFLAAGPNLRHGFPGGGGFVAHHQSAFLNQPSQMPIAAHPDVLLRRHSLNQMPFTESHHSNFKYDSRRAPNFQPVGAPIGDFDLSEQISSTLSTLRLSDSRRVGQMRGFHNQHYNQRNQRQSPP